MAKRFSQNEIIFEKKFQNANNVIDIAIFARSKPKLNTYKTVHKYVRKCLVAEKVKEIENNQPIIDDTSHNNKIMDRNKISIKDSSKTNKHRYEDEIKEQTWSELMQQYNDDNQTIKLKKKIEPRYKYGHSKYLKKTAVLSPKINSNKQKNLISEKNVQQKPKFFLNTNKEVQTLPLDMQLIADNSVTNEVDKISKDNDKYRKTDNLKSCENRNNYSKTLPKHSFTNNKSRVATHDQTHSPFGESALLLLHRLHERLKSQGDNEGSDMVSAIEAYFSGGREECLNAKKSETSSIMYPEVFVGSDQQSNNEQLKLQLLEHKKTIEDQEQMISQLRELSEKLIHHHLENNSTSMNAESEMKGDVFQNENTRINELSEEIRNLKKKVKDQLELIINLELKNSSLEQQLRSKTGLENIPKKYLVKQNECYSENDSAFDENSGSRSSLRSPMSSKVVKDNLMSSKILYDNFNSVPNTDLESVKLISQNIGNFTNSGIICESVQPYRKEQTLDKVGSSNVTDPSFSMISDLNSELSRCLSLNNSMSDVQCLKDYQANVQLMDSNNTESRIQL